MIVDASAYTSVPGVRGAPSSTSGAACATLTMTAVLRVSGPSMSAARPKSPNFGAPYRE